MTKAALTKARNKVAELVGTTANPDAPVGDVIRAIQNHFAAWLLENDDAEHEVQQGFIRAVILYKRAKIGTSAPSAPSASNTDDDIPDYLKERRAHGYHDYIDNRS